MKKLILTSVALVFFSLFSFAQENGKCQKKCGSQVAQTACNGNSSTASIYSLTDFSKSAEVRSCGGAEVQKCGGVSSQKCTVANSQKCGGAAAQKSSVAESKKANVSKGQNKSIAKL
jgi:hypothetical protein